MDMAAFVTESYAIGYGATTVAVAIEQPIKAKACHGAWQCETIEARKRAGHCHGGGGGGGSVRLAATLAHMLLAGVHFTLVRGV